MSVTPDMFRQSLDKIVAAADAAGRVFERGFASVHLLSTRVDRTYEDALEAASKSLSRRYAMDFRRAAQRYCALGRPQGVVETIRRFYEAGARHVILNFVGPYEERFDEIERFDIIDRESPISAGWDVSLGACSSATLFMSSYFTNAAGLKPNS
jgi:alkanesulfonate monooxygenase SsuD/methylene tetrahydromethanopterin reductase-like flavin-dependent oxidoreductase (luciferase family)